jgi:hypothetical protein
MLQPEQDRIFNLLFFLQAPFIIPVDLGPPYHAFET